MRDKLGGVESGVGGDRNMEVMTTPISVASDWTA